MPSQWSQSLSGNQFRVEAGALQRSSNSATVDFNVFPNALAQGLVSDAFAIDIAGQPYIYALVGGSGYRVKIGEWEPTTEAVADYAARRSEVAAIVFDGSSGGSTPAPNPAPSSPVSTIEATLSMSGHQIIDGLPATTPSGFVILSQLTELSQALTTVINAGDAAVQADIDALEVVVANLPAGLTMPTVQAAIDAAVAAAVFNEALDDDQKQAIVDAALAQLSTIDTAVLGRVGAAEAILASLEPRVAALEVLTATHTSQIVAGVTKDAEQDAAIAAVAAGVAGAVEVNNAQDLRLGNIENAAAIVNQAITPVVVNLSAGAVASAVGVALGDVSIDNSNTTHMSVTINLGASNAGKRRVATAFRVINGVEEEFGCSKVRSGESYVFSFLKTRAGSNAVTLVLN